MGHRRGHRLPAGLVALGLLAAACSSSSGGGSATTRPPATGDDQATTDQGAPVPEVDGGAEAVWPDPDWPTATPDDMGYTQAGIDELVAYLEGTGSSCMAVVAGGRLIAEQYWHDTDASSDYEIFSASKSVSSTLVGIAQDMGFLSVDEPASTYITEWQGTDSEAVTVRNLLSNDSGRFWAFRTDYVELTNAEDRSAFAVGLEQQFEPGTEWEYNNAAIQTLETVLERSTGQDMGDFADEHLFGPIGMSTSIARDPSGNPAAYMGVQAGCLDLARFGYLFLRDGEWDGDQVVSADWVAEATTSSTELNAAYGYLWWLNATGSIELPGFGTDADQLWPGAPDDAFAAMGLGDQYAVVVPSMDLVMTRIGPLGASGGTDVGEMLDIVQRAVTDDVDPVG